MYPTLSLTFIKLQTVNFIDKDVNLIESMSLDKQGNVRRNRNSMFCRTKRNDISRTECIRLSHRIFRNTHASQQTGQSPITFPQPIRPQPSPASCLSNFHTTAQENRPLQQPDTIPRYSYGHVPAPHPQQQQDGASRIWSDGAAS